MKQKILFLIISCVVTVVALACIQGYFIYNTYQLYARDAKAVITQELLKLETSGKLDSINSVWMKKTGVFIQKFKDGNAKQEDYKALIAKTSDSLSQVMSNYISRKKIFEDYDVTYSNYVVSAVVLSPCLDTITKGKLLLFTNNVERGTEIQASQSNWRGNTSDILKNGQDNGYDFEVITERYYSITDWEEKVIVKMAGLLIFSVLLVVFVVLLFYYSIKSLIQQKRIADVKTDFVNNITHEFQTPLAALDIAVKTLQRDDVELSHEQFDNSLSIINRQNSRMQKLFSQVTQASLSPDLASANIESLGYSDISSIINDFRLSHPAVTIRYEKNDAILLIDRFHLSTVLNNLLDNAVKYGADEITVTTLSDRKEAKLWISDNGPGIPEKEQKAIFDKFYRIEKGNIHNTKGLGLGLYYVYQVIKAYGGSINVESRENNGATFNVILPA
jgi:two-component system, OmpR family, phosphate regulon sensor histidine kinase PhoR